MRCFSRPLLVFIAGMEDLPDDGADHGHGHGVSGLLPNLAVVADNPEAFGESLQAQLFAGRQAALAVHEQIVVGSTRPQGARKRVATDIAALVFMPYGGAQFGGVLRMAAGANARACEMPGIRIRLQKIRKRLVLLLLFGPFEGGEGALMAEADDDRPFPLLRKPVVQGVEDAPVAPVAGLAQHGQNARHGPALIVACDLPDVFQHECLRAFRLEDADHFID